MKVAATTDAVPDTASELEAAAKHPLREARREVQKGLLARALRVFAFSAYFAALLVIWELAVRASNLPSFILPPPSEVGSEFYRGFNLLVSNSWVTVYESLVGLGAAILIGVAVALFLAYWNWARITVFPTMLIFESIPKVALAPLVVVWFGLGTSSKIVTVIMLCVFPVALSTLRGLMSVDVDYLDLMQTIHARRWEVFIRVRLPFSIPYLFTGIKIAVPLAMIGAVIGEFVTAQHGLGYLILSNSQNLETAKSLAAIALVTVWSTVFFQVVALLERTTTRLFPVGQVA